MTVFLGFLVVAAILAVIMAGFAWFAIRMKRSGVGGGIMGPIDEIYRPTAHESRIEIQVQEERGIRDLSGRDPLP
jgi:hypothetical protein